MMKVVREADVHQCTDGAGNVERNQSEHEACTSQAAVPERHDVVQKKIGGHSEPRGRSLRQHEDHIRKPKKHTQTT